MKEYFFDTDGNTLNYAKGPDNGPPLVLIPGQGTTWESYDPVFKGLSKTFQVFAISIRGHGKSDWTTGDYDFDSIGKDMTLFLREIVKSPAIICGNSSGGLIGLWLSVNEPQMVMGLVLEDAPLFSAEWPRIKSEFVYEILGKTAKYLDRKDGPDYVGLFNNIKRPLPNGTIKTIPLWMCKLFAWLINHRESLLGKIILKMLPRTLRLSVNIIPNFDPDFARAWIDGRFYKGLNHENALKQIKLPLLILHADWYRTEKGLVGAMDDNDAQKAIELAPHAKYIRIHTRHVIHSGKPKEFVRIIKEFYQEIKKHDAPTKYKHNAGESDKNKKK